MKRVGFLKFPLEASRGGAERHTLELAKYLGLRGLAVKVFTSDEYLFRMFEKARLPRQRLFFGPEPTSKNALLQWPLTAFRGQLKLRKVLREFRTGDVLVFQSLTEKLLLTKPARRLGLKVIWLEHKVPGRWLVKNPLRYSFLRLAKQVRAVTVSQFAKNEFLKLGIGAPNLTVISPGVEVKIAAGRDLLRPKTSKYYTIGVLGRLEPEKGIYEFLQELASPLKTRPRWRIMLAGEGEYEEKIARLVADQNLQEQISLLGYVENLQKFFSQISVLSYPTKAAESFGLAALEAQSFGVPVVASNLGALPEIVIHEKTGLLVEWNKPSSWLEALQRLSSPELQEKFSLNATEKARDFSLDKALQSFAQLLEA